MPMTFRLAEHGRTLSTRWRGAAVRGDLLVRLQGAQAVLDCEDVLAISYSFADEFAGKLAQGSEDWPPIELQLVHASRSVAEPLETAIGRRTSARAAG
jgi:hypothetical protein